MLRRLLEFALGASVAVEDRLTVDVAGVDGHVQGIDDQRGAHVLGELPADDHPRGEIDHGREVEPALAGFEVGDVTDQALARCAAGRVEVPPDQVRRVDGVLAGNGGAFVGAWLHRPQPEFAHQVGDQPDAALVAFAVQLRRDPPAPRGLPGAVEDPPHLDAQQATARRGRRLHRQRQA